MTQANEQSISEQNRTPSMHISGIGGTLMVAGARLALEAGWEVRGSDTPLYPPVSEMVTRLGVPVASGYAAENLDWGPGVVVIGNALSRGNPEVEAALERRMRYVSLPEWLKEQVLRARRPVAICGTHGKTTTTAMTAFLLDACGMVPGYLVGGQPVDFEHSARLGAAGAPFVIEGDEYDTAFFDKRAKFFHYLPEIAVVTSVEFDHGDIYPDLAAIEQAFRWMLRQVPGTGWAVLCADDPGAAALRCHAHSRVATYGLADGADVHGERLERCDGMERLRVQIFGADAGEVRVPMAGRHNLRNALAAIAVAHLLGIGFDAIREALPRFRGVKRRLEVFHEARGMVFVDDFAHHPTALGETVRAARERWPKRRLVVVFEPRSNTTVTNRFQRELAAAFSAADAVLIGPVHRAESVPPDERLDVRLLVETIAPQARACGSATDIAETLERDGRAGDLVLICSNGAFGGLYGMLRERIA